MSLSGRAAVSRLKPEAHAICDRCGARYLHRQLSFQYDWRGPKLQNLRILVCESCLDKPQQQLRTIILPADPVPIANPRPEAYTIDNNPISAIGTSFGNMVNMAGLNAAFDSNVNKPLVQSCAQNVSVAVYGSYVGRHFANAVTLGGFSLYAPNNAPFLASGPVNYKIQGSNLSVGFTDIFSGTTVGTVGESITQIVNAAASYLFIRVAFSGDGSQLGLAQFQIRAA